MLLPLFFLRSPAVVCLCCCWRPHYCMHRPWLSFKKLKAQKCNPKTMKWLDQGHLHSLLRHPRDKHVSAGNWTWVACVAGEHSSKELWEYFVLLLFRTSTNLHGCPTAYESNSWIITSSESFHVCRLIGNKLLTDFTRIALVSEAPLTAVTFKSACCTSRSPQLRELTKVTSIFYYSTLRQTSLGQESNPGRRRAL